jgi:hypothetical protein
MQNRAPKTRFAFGFGGGCPASISWILFGENVSWASPYDSALLRSVHLSHQLSVLLIVSVYLSRQLSTTGIVLFLDGM